LYSYRREALLGKLLSKNTHWQLFVEKVNQQTYADEVQGLE